VDALRVARERVLERIADACARAGRKPSDVTLLAVSKTFGPDVVRDAVAAGLNQFGENRVQEASAKVGEVAGSTWHLVGPLQANKARKALEVFASIQTVDSIPLAERLDRIAGELRPGARYPVLLQVNVDDDPAKVGFGPDRLAEACERLAGCDALEIRGLMTIGRLVDSAEAARPTFRKLREIAEALRAAGHQIGPDLSMGMTDDFDVAVEEGATIVRVGRALFGERHLHDDDGPADHVHDSATRRAVSRA
jgi:PLP dependent protein